MIDLIDNETATDDQVADVLEAEANATEYEQIEDAKSTTDDQEAIEKAKREAELKAKATEAFPLVAGTVKAIANGCEKKWPCLEFKDEDLMPVAQQASVVMAKYNCEWPPWLEAYKDEIILGWFLSNLIYGSYQVIREDKRVKAKEKEVNKTPQPATGEDDAAQPQQHAKQ